VILRPLSLSPVSPTSFSPAAPTSFSPAAQVMMPVAEHLFFLKNDGEGKQTIYF